MKRKIFCFAMLMTLILSSVAQVPHTFCYQAVVRNADNKLVSGKQVIVHVEILQGAENGTIIYSERQVTQTNINGLMTIELGTGESNNDFSSIDWDTAPYYVKTIINIDGRSVKNTTPLFAVPYALYAVKANVDFSDYAKITDIPEPVDMSDYALISQIPTPVDLREYAKSKDVESTYIKKTDLKDYALVSQIPEQLDLSDYAKTVDVADSYTSKSEMIGYYKKDEFSDWLDYYILKLGLDEGSIHGKFSISAERQIYFSKGNLQYQASTNTWKFANHQWDMIGYNNKNISKRYTGLIDLFGYGTSGYNGYYPYLTNKSRHIAIAETNYDWGVYNTISNAIGDWRTPTKEEFNYLLNRKNGQLCGIGCVDTIKGLILLPDDWTNELSIDFTPNSSDYETNSYTFEEWLTIQSYGAVFLPAGGMREGTEVHHINPEYGRSENCGYYWLGSGVDEFVDILCFSSYNNIRLVYMKIREPLFGYSVRLVRDLK